jgi:hypothetical protein
MFHIIFQNKHVPAKRMLKLQRKTVQTTYPTTVSTANPSIHLLLHITALEGHFDVMISLNMDVMNWESSEKTAWFEFNFISSHEEALETLY